MQTFMMKKRYLFILLLLVFSQNRLIAQNPAILEYINTYKFLAIKEMRRTGVPASIKLAQGILETQAGASDLVKRSNNHFGIKCKTGWSGDKVFHDDDEKGECFRSYASAEDSYRDHSDFLKGSSRYAFLFQLDPTDYKDWAKGLKKAGYATNPKYTQQLIKYIEDYDLQLYTRVALGQNSMEEEAPVFVKNNTPQTGMPEMGSGSNNTASVGVPLQSLRDRFPDGVFKINDTRVMVAVAGTSLLQVSEQYDIKYKHLLDFNDLNENDDIIRKDQLLFLQRKRRQGANVFHLVKPSETLYDIAQEEAIRLEFLLSYNRLTEDAVLTNGQKLFLQKNATEHNALLKEDIADGRKESVHHNRFSTAYLEQNQHQVKHVVQTKETLFSIARKYEVDVDQIRSWNRLRDNTIRSGQQLLIYKN